MKKITYTEFQSLEQGIVFITTPFCGVCKTTRRLLEILESSKALAPYTFYELHHIYIPQISNDYKVTHAPALARVIREDEQLNVKIIYKCLTILDIVSEVKEGI